MVTLASGLGNRVEYNRRAALCYFKTPFESFKFGTLAIQAYPHKIYYWGVVTTGSPFSKKMACIPFPWREEVNTTVISCRTLHHRVHRVVAAFEARRCRWKKRKNRPAKWVAVSWVTVCDETAGMALECGSIMPVISAQDMLVIPQHKTKKSFDFRKRRRTQFALLPALYHGKFLYLVSAEGGKQLLSGLPSNA